MATPRPDALNDIAGLARTYAALIRKLGLDGVTLIGNSLGGWIAAELALLAPTLVKKLVLVDAAGIEVPGHPVADVFSLSMDELSRLSYRCDTRKGEPSRLSGNDYEHVWRVDSVGFGSGDVATPFV
jgi:pimeloyl-ACP methyl ester carboxylesterase